jgi:hypothetical protein
MRSLPFVKSKTFVKRGFELLFLHESADVNLVLDVVKECVTKQTSCDQIYVYI